jgi:hypothetical protein
MPRRGDRQVRTGCCQGRYGTMVGAPHNPVHRVGGETAQVEDEAITYASPPLTLRGGNISWNNDDDDDQSLPKWPGCNMEEDT